MEPPVDTPTPSLSQSTCPATLDIDGYLADPAAELRRCAAESWRAEAIDEQGRPLPIVLGFDDVRSVLRDRRLSPRSFTDDMIAAGLSTETAHQLTPLFRRHGEAHRNFRGLLAAAFTPRSIERMRPVAAEVADALADKIVERGGACEFVQDVAEPLPPEVFAVLFGLPPAERDNLARWAAAVTPAFAPPLDAHQVAAVEGAAAELRVWCAELIDLRRQVPTDDLVTHLMTVEVDGQRLDAVDVTAVVSGFVFAGAETTKRQLTQMVVAFAQHPDSWRRVGAEPALIANAVEEVMRHRPIVPGLSRVAVDPYEHAGLVVAPDGRVIVSIETANHDPAIFAEPDAFDVGREGAEAHLTFGWGPHFCVGAGLARVEMQEALRSLVSRFGPPVLIDTDPDDVAGGFSGPTTLQVEFTPLGT